MTDMHAMTPLEHKAMEQLSELWTTLCQVVDDGPSRDGDLQELIGHVHALQRAVMAQAAARDFPEKYRLLGAQPPSRRKVNLVERLDLEREHVPRKLCGDILGHSSHFWSINDTSGNAGLWWCVGKGPYSNGG